MLVAKRWAGVGFGRGRRVRGWARRAGLPVGSGLDSWTSIGTAALILPSSMDTYLATLMKTATQTTPFVKRRSAISTTAKVVFNTFPAWSAPTFKNRMSVEGWLLAIMTTMATWIWPSTIAANRRAYCTKRQRRLIIGCAPHSEDPKATPPR